MNQLELRLTALRDEVAFPPTPDFAAAAERIAAEAARPRRVPRGRRRLAYALAALLVVGAGVLAFSEGARSAFLELFRLKGASVGRVETLPQVDRLRLDLGERVSLAEAERRAGFRVLALADEEPTAVFARGSRVVSLVYGPPEEPRLVLSQLRAEIWDGVHKKLAGPGTTIEDVVVDGEPGLFISGEDHVVMFVEDGVVRDEQTALAGTVLLWNRGELLLRLEGDLTRDEAVALAESVG